MNAREANILLTRASQLDSRFSWESAGEQASAAQAWAGALADVELTEALQALAWHYRESPVRILPVHVLERVPSRSRTSAEEEERAAWLAARGLTEEDVARMPRAELEQIVNGGDRGVS